MMGTFVGTSMSLRLLSKHASKFVPRFVSVYHIDGGRWATSNLES